MKAKLKPHKLLSMLLTLVMLLSLLPTTALAATYYDKVKVNDIDLQDGYYLESNDSTSAKTGATTAPTTYVAWYKGGVLTLNGYDGTDIAVQGLDVGDLTIKLIGDNTITPYRTGIQGNSKSGSITITADSSGGKLTINVSNSTQSVYGIDGDENSVTITGSADVTIIAKAENASDNSYGIKSNAAVSILGDASVNITSKTPSSTRTNACYGIYSKKDVTIDTEGTIQINVHDEAGTAEAASYGVYSLGNLTLTKVGGMTVKWKKAGVYGAPYYPITASFSGTDHAINVDETNCYASYRHGTPYTVTVENGTLTCANVVPSAKESGNFLAGDLVSITPDTKKGRSGEEIPFKEWTSSDVTLTSPTTASNSFTVPGKDVTVTAMHNPFDGAPTFTPTGTTGTEGTLTFKTMVKLYDGNEYFALVKEADVNDTGEYKPINPSTTSLSSPYEYSYETRSLHGVNQVDEGDYYVAEKLNGTYYLSEKFTVNYTAAPTGNYPDYVRVYNGSGTITSLSDGQYLAANAATGASDGYTDGTSYVARYDKSTGTLYLNGYQNDHQIIAPDSVIFADGDLNIEVVSDSGFSTSVSATNDLYGIRANGTLTISGSGKLTVSANGNGNVYGIYADKGVTISAPLEVKVGKVDSSTNGPVHGIYAQSGAISLSGNDMTVTATGGNEAAYGVYNAADTSTTITDNGYIDISGNLTVNLSNGSSNVGIRTGSGGTITLNDAKVNIPGNFKIGIYNNNGNVVIKNKSDVTLTSDVSNSWGVYAKYGGDLIIENSTVSISTTGYAASLENGGLTIKNSTVDLTMDAETYLVVNTYHSATNTIDLSGSGSVTLTASGNQTGSMIAGKVTLGTNTKCVKGTFYDSYQNYDGEYDGSSKTVLQFVHESAAPTTTYEVTVTNGAGSGNYAEGETVTITANAASDGEMFDKWEVVSGSITLADANSATTTFEMPAGAVSVKATYFSYITVNLAAGEGSGTMEPIIIKNTYGYYGLIAPECTFTAPANKVFDKWQFSKDDSYLKPGDTKSLWSSDNGATLTAIWKDAPVTPAINSVTVSPATAEVVKGKTQQFTATVDKTGEIADTVTWSVNSTKSTISDTGLLTVGSDETATTLTVTATSTADTTKNGTATVTVKKVSVYYITVYNGNVTDGAGNSLLAVPEGAEIIFTANEPETGKQFKEWTGLDGVEFVDGTSKTSSTAKIKMPARAVTATAVYEDAPNANPAKPTISVNGTYTYTGSEQTATVSGYDSTTMNITGNVGTNAGGYTVSVTSKTGKWADGTTDAVTADWSIQKANPTYEVPTGLEGTKGNALSTVTLPAGFTWADGTTEMNTTGNQTFPATFTPSDTDNYNVVNNISVTVNVKEAAPTTYEVTVTNGTGGGNYEEGATVTITANAAPADKVFDKWEVVSGSITLADANSATTTFTMPAGAVSVKATYKDKPVTTYTVTVNGSYASTTGAGSYNEGDTVYISAGSRSGYTFDGWTSSNVTITDADSRNASFVMPDNDVTVTAHWTRNAVPVTPTEPSTYTIKVEKTDNGDVTVSHKSASKGTTVTLTVEPDKGYTLETLTVTDKNGDEIRVKEKNGKYTFTMPASKVYVEATFMEDNSMLNFFVDVPADAYYYDAVLWAAKNGITGGVDDTHFAPNATCTRAQAVTFLWRAAGSPAPKNSMMPFTDVPAGSYYEQAVLWAVENCITKGTSATTFSPNATCSRGQIVTFLWRSQKSPASDSVNPFADVAADAYYNSAVLWAVTNGITDGTSATTFSPAANCTRAQIVTFLYRYFVK